MDKKPVVLLVEDEPHLHETLRLNLELEGYEVFSAMDGKQALQQLAQAHFDVVVLDWMMPEMDGITILEHLRLHQKNLPVLMLSARSQAQDRVTGLKAGADDYLSKPFHLEELLLRVQKLVQKGQALAAPAPKLDKYQFGPNQIDFNLQEAIGQEGQTIALSRKETLLLKLLVEHEGEVVDRDKILQVVWGYQVYPTTRTIDNFILGFRKYFEADSRNPQFFHSVRGVGYRFTRGQQ